MEVYPECQRSPNITYNLFFSWKKALLPLYKVMNLDSVNNMWVWKNQHSRHHHYGTVYSFNDDIPPVKTNICSHIKPKRFGIEWLSLPIFISKKSKVSYKSGFKCCFSCPASFWWCLTFAVLGKKHPCSKR